MVSQLSFDGYDVDYAGELEVYLNGNLIDRIPNSDRPDWNEVWIPHTYDVTAFATDTNIVTFTLGSPRHACSVKNIKLTFDSTILIEDHKTYTISDESPSATIGVERVEVAPAFPWQYVAIGLGILFGGAILYMVLKRKK